ncbi:MAG: TrmH family RNA methyltransferase [Flavobacteriales bacterium]
MANNRTRYFTAVLEDIYQAQNTSAILRSAEAWAMQDLHVVENEHSFAHHRRIAKGAKDWLSVHRYNERTNNSEVCLRNLKSRGYKIAVTALGEDSIPLAELDLSSPVAIVLGTELTGASETALRMADQKVIIPMYGFTESLNVSVAAGVIFNFISGEIRKRNLNWQLSNEEKLALKIQWAKKTIYWSDYLVEMFESGELK